MPTMELLIIRRTQKRQLSSEKSGSSSSVDHYFMSLHIDLSQLVASPIMMNKLEQAVTRLVKMVKRFDCQPKYLS